MEVSKVSEMVIQKDVSSNGIDLAKSSGQLLIGKVLGFKENGNPIVNFEGGQSEPIEALSTVPLGQTEIGKDVAVSFAQNQGGVAIVMGVIRRLIDDVLSEPNTDNKSEPPAEAKKATPEVLVDGDRLELNAPEEVTIRCGEASITLNKNGKILVKGEHMLNRMSGTFKIKSGSIDLN